MRQGRFLSTHPKNLGDKKMKRKLRYAVPFSAVAVALTVSSIAWACTPENGSTFITTPNCSVSICEASRGTTIYAHARFVNPTIEPNNYELYLSVQPWCHNDSRNAVLSYDQTANTSGVIPAINQDPPLVGTDIDQVTSPDGKKFADVAGLIPATWSRGTYDVCFNNGQGGDTTNASYSTSPVALTVKR